MVFKCKMCGGDIVQVEGTNTGKCKYCKSVMTLPNLDNEKIINLYNRANFLRINNEFDKARTVYENILSIDNKQVEAHWGLILCKFGVEYVDDPKHKKKVPTCHRTLDHSIMTDPDFKIIKKEAYGDALKIYEFEAKLIDHIQKQILEISSKEKPYDVFICYKETDDSGERTYDSVIAQDIYDKLTSQGFKVFFSRITLENKLGTQYEPYIYSALKSSKVMLVVGTKEEHFNAVWVKNEWSRYLEMMKKDKGKTLIPVHSKIDAYKLPEEFAMLQAQNMDKIGAMQDLTRGVKKLIEEYKTEDVDGVDKETVAKVKAALDDARNIGNGQFEVTMVKEKLPLWYYILTIFLTVVVGFSYLLSLEVNIFQVTFNNSYSTLDLLEFTEITPLPLVFLLISGLLFIIGVACSFINRKLFKKRKYFFILSLLFEFFTYFTVLQYGFILFDSFTFIGGIVGGIIILCLINPSWILDVSKKSIMNTEDKDKQIEINKKIKKNFKVKEKKCVKPIFYIILVVVVLIYFIYLFSIGHSQTNKQDKNKNQVEIVGISAILNKPQTDFNDAKFLGILRKGEVYNIIGVEQDENNRYAKIKTNNGISGLVLVDNNVKVHCLKDSKECIDNFVQTNERNTTVKQLEVLVDFINIREEAGTYYGKKGQIYKGEIYTILNEKSELTENCIWYEIKTTNGITGWIAGSYKGEEMVKILR